MNDQPKNPQSPLSPWGKGKNIEIQPAWIAAQAQQQWWAGLEAKYREITIEQVTPGDANLLVEGMFSNAWDIPGWGKAWQDQKIVLTVVEQALGAPEITIDQLSGKLELDGQMLTLQTRPDLLGHHVFEAIDAPKTAQLLDRAGEQAQSDTRLQALALLGSWTQTDYSMRLLSARNGSTSQQWNVAVPDLALGELKSPLQDLHLTVVRQSGKNLRTGDTHFLARGRIKLDQDYEARLTFASARHVTISVAAEEGKAFPGPAGILKVLGFDEAAGQVTDALSQVPLLDTFKLEQVQIHVNLADKKLLGFGLFGSFMLLESKIHFSLDYPSLTLTATLAAETPIPAGKLLSEWVGNSDLLPSNMKVSNLGLRIGAQPFQFTFSLVMQDLWKFELGNVPIEINALELRIHKGPSGVSGQLSGDLHIAGIDFGLSAEKEASASKDAPAPGWQLRGFAAVEEPIRLHELARKLAEYFQIELPANLPKIALSNISVAFHTQSRDFSLSATAKLEEPLGPVKEAELRLELEIAKQPDENDTVRKRQLHIKLTGSVQIKDPNSEKTWSIALDADLGKPEWSISGSWKADDESAGMSLLAVAKWVHPKADFGDLSPAVRSALTITKISLGYYHSAQPVFVGTAETAGGQEAKLLITKIGETWGGVLGIGYQKPADAPHFGKLLQIGSRSLVLENAWLMFSWLPATSSSALPAQMTDVPFPVELSELGKGLALAAVLDLKKDTTGAFTNLQKASNETRFTILGRLSNTGVALRLQWDGLLSFPTGKQGGTLRIRGVVIDLGIDIEPPKFEIAASGRIDFNLYGHPVQSRVSLDLSQESFDLKLGASFPEGGIELFNLRDVRIHNLWLWLGFGFSKGSIDIGMGGEMTFRPNQSQPEKLGVLLEIVGDIPVPKFIAIDITRVDLADLLDAFIGQAGRGKKYVKQDLVGAEGLSFQYASSNLTLPLGEKVLAGTRFSGVFHILEWRAYLDFEFFLNSGFTAAGSFDSIEGKGYHLKGNGNSIALFGTGSGVNWKPLTSTQRLDPKLVPTLRYVTNGGGPTIRFSSQKSPYLACSFDMAILNAFKTILEVEIGKEGLSFDFITRIEGLHSLKLKVLVRSTEYFHAKGELRAGPYVKIGWHRVGLEIRGDQEIRSGSKQDFKYHWKFGYFIFGQKLPGMEINIPKAPKNFGEVVQIAVTNFLQNLPLVQLAKELLRQGPGKEYKAGRSELIKPRAIAPPAWPSQMKQKLMIEPDVSAASLALPVSKMRGSLMEDDTMRLMLPIVVAESSTEVARLQEIGQALAPIHAARIARGTQTMEAQMQVMQQEILELEDRNGDIRGHVSAIWEAHYSSYEALFCKIEDLAELEEADFETAKQWDAHLAELNGLRRQLAQLDATIEDEWRRLGATDQAPDLPYTEVALSHHAALEQQKRLGDCACKSILDRAKRNAEKMLEIAKSALGDDRPRTIELYRIQE